MESTKKPNYFLRITFLIFIIFIVVYIIGRVGYYETSLRKEVTLTSDAIKKFEEDILNGEKVDLNSYINTDEKDYSNIFTSAGESINNGLVNIFVNGVDEVIQIFNVLF